VTAVQRAIAALLAFLALAGCGGGEEGGAPPAATGGATLWVTRDEGAKVLLTAKVPAGDTVLQALDRHADVETSYGGRFVQVVNGMAGSLGEQRDWFFFVNGIEPSVGSDDIELREGDVAWWDYRDWSERMAAPIVVGAFPEPFRHGWEGKRRPAKVQAPAGFEAESETLLRVLGGSGGKGEPNVFRLVAEEGTEGATLRARRGPADASPATFILSGAENAVRAAADALAADPSIVRFRYVARFDESGRVVG
jgi:hypothetical protein